MNHGNKIEKAVLLAAGLGTRLRPLTNTTPKPLLPLDGTLLIDHQIRWLSSYGVKEIAINLHHLGGMIKRHVGDGSRYGVKIFYSEEPVILGTGGGIRKAATLTGRAPFIVLNCDAIIDADLGKLTASHMQKNPAATMVLRRLSNGDDYTPVSIDDDGFVRKFGSGDYSFTGLQIVGPQLVDVLPPAGEVSCLVDDGYKKLLEMKALISSFIHEGYWNDIGTMERYELAKRDVADKKFTPRII